MFCSLTWMLVTQCAYLFMKIQGAINFSIKVTFIKFIKNINYLKERTNIFRELRMHRKYYFYTFPTIFSAYTICTFITLKFKTKFFWNL